MHGGLICIAFSIVHLSVCNLTKFRLENNSCLMIRKDRSQLWPKMVITHQHILNKGSRHYNYWQMGSHQLQVASLVIMMGTCQRLSVGAVNHCVCNPAYFSLQIYLHTQGSITGTGCVQEKLETWPYNVIVELVIFMCRKFSRILQDLRKIGRLELKNGDPLS